jgi:hypothetical protein
MQKIPGFEENREGAKVIAKRVGEKIGKALFRPN